jgi:Uma2 family endonuclease
MGTSRHQLTILNLRLGINEIAHAERRPGEPLPWQALGQTMVSGFTRPDGSPYTTLPDIFIYRQPINIDRGSISVAVDGPPVLVIEVASESTYETDLSLKTGKAWTYGHGGVREYLVLDPLAIYLTIPGRGWRLVDGRFEHWAADDEGIWWSEEIPVGFKAADGVITVYDRARQPQLREGEVRETLARKDAEIEELRRRLEQLEGR